MSRSAETLEGRDQPGLYRIHDQPDPVKLEAVRAFLHGLGHGLTLAKGQVVHPPPSSPVLRQKVRALPEAQLISDIVLRAQAQAVYAHDNIGHFGLALAPLRPFHLADPPLCRSHRPSRADRGPEARARRAGAQPAPAWTRSGRHISMTERRAAGPSATRSTAIIARFMDRQSAPSSAGGSAASPGFGLFVTLDETGADGLLPIATLPRDDYRHDRQRQTLTGRRTRRQYGLGQSIRVRLIESDPIGSGLVFALAEPSARNLRRSP